MDIHSCKLVYDTMRKGRKQSSHSQTTRNAPRNTIDALFKVDHSAPCFDEQGYRVCLLNGRHISHLGIDGKMIRFIRLQYTYFSMFWLYTHCKSHDIELDIASSSEPFQIKSSTCHGPSTQFDETIIGAQAEEKALASCDLMARIHRPTILETQSTRYLTSFGGCIPRVV